MRRVDNSVGSLGPRGDGVLLPEGYVEEERIPTARTSGSRPYKIYRAPDGKVLLSRPEAWRYFASAEAAAEAARGFRASAGNYEFVPASPEAERPPSPAAREPPVVAQPNSGPRRSARAAPSAVQPAATAKAVKGKGSRLRGELRSP